jgi:hypothetical protein
MTPASARTFGNIVLSLAVLELLVTLLGMLGIVPKLAPSREMVPLGAALVIGGGALRRHGAREQT